MSSHIMSDVEKICQRVAVIRSGSLVAVEAVEALREKAGQQVTVEFGEAVLANELAGIPGISMVTQTNGSFHFNISGSMDSLIKTLSQYNVTRLHSQEAPLEEVFLKFYEEPDKAAQTARQAVR